MKIQLSLFLLCIAFSVSAFSRQAKPVITVQVSDEAYKDVVASVADMAYWLYRSTGEKFDIKRSGPGDISIVETGLSSLKKDLKNQLFKDGQTFYLKASHYRSAVIVGSGANAITNGIYTFLHALGFRWYMPGDTWTIVPEGLKNNRVSIETVSTPDFRNRYYFGTGGLAPIAGLDIQNSFKEDFDLWNRRNRLSSDYPIHGHVGQGFYGDNKILLDRHPEYFCNNTANPSGRLNIANKEGVAAFTNWALKQVKPSDRFPVVGVDPADGSGTADDCLPSNMPQVKSWSDKYFWLANQVAQKAEEKAPGALVQLYAYANHAAPPNFPLHRNVFPVIVPYAFQDVAEPDQFIQLWQQKLNGKPMGLYDYWNITQWSVDLPQLNIYSIPEKLRFWKQNNVNTINLESTNAKGPVGHALWLATQMMWNTTLSFDSLYNSFLEQSFGRAAPDIKRMYDRWSLNYQSEMEVALSLNDLAAASGKTNNPAIQNRIAELKAYIHYVKLYYDYQYKATPDNYRKLINYIYSIHHWRLLQTSALVTSYIKKPGDVAVPIPNKLAALTYDQAEKNFKVDRAENPALYSLSPFDIDETKAYPVNAKVEKESNPLYINGTNTYSFYLPKKQTFEIKAGATADTRLAIKDAKGRVWYDKTIAGSKEGYQTIRTELPKGKYELTFGAYYRFGRLIFPADIVFLSSGKYYDNYGYPLQYVYVPKGVSEIIYKDEEGPGTNGRGNWIDPGGKTVQPELLKHKIYRVPVPPRFRGQVWTLNIGHAGYELLNIPDVFSLRNFAYNE